VSFDRHVEREPPQGRELQLKPYTHLQRRWAYGLEFCSSQRVMLAINLIYAIIAVFVGVVALRIIDRKVLTRVEYRR